MRILAGPIVGHTEGLTARIWIHIDQVPQAPLLCHVYTSPSESIPVPGSPFVCRVRTDACIAVAELKLPQAGVHYYYRVYHGAQRLQQRPAHFRLPANQHTQVQFAVVSCNNPFAYGGAHASALWQHLSTAINASDAPFVLHVGDQVYMDDVVRHWMSYGRNDKESLLQRMREAYCKTWSLPDVGHVLANTPQYMMWDDHEIANGWGSSTRHRREDYQTVFSCAAQAFTEFQQPLNPSGPAQADGFYYSFTKGRCTFLVLDLRSQRQLWCKQLLGDRQKQWIEAELATSRSDLLFVVCSVPLFHLSRLLAWLPVSDVTDQWSHAANKADRKWLLQRLFDWKRGNAMRKVVLLGGDVHVATFANIALPSDPKLTMVQVTTSPIANRPASWIDNVVRRLAHDFTVHTESGEAVSVNVFKRFVERNFLTVSAYCPEHGVPAVQFNLHREGQGISQWHC